MSLSNVTLMCLESSLLLKTDLLFTKTKSRRVKRERIPARINDNGSSIVRRNRFAVRYRLLRNNPEDFFPNVKFSAEVFDYILDHVRDDLGDAYLEEISAEEKLFKTLKFLTGDVPFKDLAKTLCSNPKIAHRIIFITLDIIWKKLSPLHLRPPTHAEIIDLAKDYYEKWNFPNCVGAIGGKYIRLYNTAMGITKKGIINAIVDANFRFLTVYVERKRSTEESFIRNMFDISGMQCLPGTEVMLPLFVIGNDAYPLKTHLMKPYPVKAAQICPEKDKFNDRIKLARVPVDCAFEILAEKWKIFNKLFTMRIEEARLVVQVICLLYNIVKDIEGDTDPHFTNFGTVDNGSIYLNLLKHKGRMNNRASSIATLIRDQVKDFIAEH